MPLSKDKQKAVDAMKLKINKRFGDGTVSTAHDVVDKLTLHRIKTPSEEFNAMLHGGLAKGKIVEFFGPNSSGVCIIN